MFRPLLRVLPSLSGNVKLVCDVEIDNKDNNISNKNNNDFTAKVKSASLSPISSNVFKKYVPVSLLTSTYDYDLKQFYNIYSDVFYKSQYQFNKAEIEILDKSKPANERDKDFEYGCERALYKYGQYQYEFFAPVYIDNINDLPDVFTIHCVFEFESYKIEKDINIKISDTNIYESTNYLYNYLYNYLNTIDSKVVKLNYNSKQQSAYYWGIDLLHGGQTVTEDTQIKEIFSKQQTLQNFDNLICQGFKRNKMVMKQIIPFSFRFNLADILDSTELKAIELCWVDFYGEWSKDNINSKSDFSTKLYDFDINYDELYIKKEIYNNETLNVSKIDNKDNKDNIYNIMDQPFPGLNDTNFIKYQFVNRISPNITRWMMESSSETDPYIVNVNQLYSINQGTNSFEYRYFPKYILSQKELPVLCNIIEVDYDNTVSLPYEKNFNSSLIANKIHNFILPYNTNYPIKDSNNKDLDKWTEEKYYTNILGKDILNSYKDYILNHSSLCFNNIYLSQDLLNEIYDEFNNATNKSVLDITSDYINNKINEWLNRDNNYNNIIPLVFDPISSINIFDKQNSLYNTSWKNVINDNVYYNDVLYDLNSIYNKVEDNINSNINNKITKFGVFILPIVEVVNNKDMNQLVSCDFIMEFLPDDSNINNYHIKPSEYSTDYMSSDNHGEYYNIDSNNTNNIDNVRTSPYSKVLKLSNNDSTKTLSDIYEQYYTDISYNNNLNKYNTTLYNYINSNDLISCTSMISDSSKNYFECGSNIYYNIDDVMSYVKSAQDFIINHKLSYWTNYSSLCLSYNDTSDNDSDSDNINNNVNNNIYNSADNIYKINITELLDNINTVINNAGDSTSKLPANIRLLLDNFKSYTGFELSDNKTDLYSNLKKDTNLWLWCNNLYTDYNKYYNNKYVNPIYTLMDITEELVSDKIITSYNILPIYNLKKIYDISNSNTYIHYFNKNSCIGHFIVNNSYYDIINDVSFNLFNKDISYNTTTNIWDYTLYIKNRFISYYNLSNTVFNNISDNIYYSKDMYNKIVLSDNYNFNGEYGQNVVNIITGLYNWLNQKTVIENKDGNKDDNKEITLFEWLCNNSHLSFFSKFSSLNIDYNNAFNTTITPNNIHSDCSLLDKIDNNYICNYTTNLNNVLNPLNNITDSTGSKQDFTPTVDKFVSYITNQYNDDTNLLTDIYSFKPYIYYNKNLIVNNVFQQKHVQTNINPITDVVEYTDNYIWTDIYNLANIIDNTNYISGGTDYLLLLNTAKYMFCDFISKKHIKLYLTDLCRNQDNKYPDGCDYSDWVQRKLYYSDINNKPEYTPFDFLYVAAKSFIINNKDNKDHKVRYKYIKFEKYFADYINSVKDYIYNDIINIYNDYTNYYNVRVVGHSDTESNNDDYKNNIKELINNKIDKFYYNININTLINSIEYSDNSHINLYIPDCDITNIQFEYYSTISNKWVLVDNIVKNYYINDIYKEKLINVHLVYYKQFVRVNKRLMKNYTTLFDDIVDFENISKDNKDNTKKYYDFYFSYYISDSDYDLNESKIKECNDYDIELLTDVENTFDSDNKQVFKSVMYKKEPSLVKPLYNDIYHQPRMLSAVYDNIKLNNIKEDTLYNQGYVYNKSDINMMIKVNHPFLNKLYQLYHKTNPGWFNRIPLYTVYNNSCQLLTPIKESKLDILNYSKYNMFTYTDGIDNYGFYIVTVPITNTSITFDSIYGIDGNVIIEMDENGQYNGDATATELNYNISMFGGFNNYPLYKYNMTDYNIYGLTEMYKKIHQLLPFTNLNPVAELFKIPVIKEPEIINIEYIYSQSKINIDNNDNIKEYDIIYTLNQNNIKPTYDNIRKLKYSKLSRYCSFIRPILKDVQELEYNNMFNYIYNTKRKNTKSLLLKTGKYNSIGDSVIYKAKDRINDKDNNDIYIDTEIDINKYCGLNIYTDLEKNEAFSSEYDLGIYYNNVLNKPYYEPEYKHFNNSKFWLLPISIEIPKYTKYNYQEILDLSTDDILYKEFADYIKNRLNKRLKIQHELLSKKKFSEEQILFLYNRYDTNVVSKWVGLNSDKTKKLYTITYKYTLK